MKDQKTPSIDKQGVLAGAAAELLHIGEEPEDVVAERIAADELLTLIEEIEEK